MNSALNTKMVLCTLHFSAILLFIGFCYVERRSSSPVVFFFFFSLSHIHFFLVSFRFFFLFFIIIILTFFIFVFFNFTFFSSFEKVLIFISLYSSSVSVYSFAVRVCEQCRYDFSLSFFTFFASH